MDDSTETIEGRAVNYIDWTVKVISAYVSHNPVPASALPRLVGETYAAFVHRVGEWSSPAPSIDLPTPAQIRRSIAADALISFEDGKPYKMLERHVARLGFTPEGYRRKWGLPNDYPMTAPNDSASRSDLAESSALGTSHRIPTAQNDHAALRNPPEQSEASNPDPGADE